jgi:site-specific DNA-methyltransferase (adenine-specific)
MTADQYQLNTAQRGDALELLRLLPDGCTPLVFFDPQHREGQDKLAYGNEGNRQKERFLLPAMSTAYIDACRREATRALRPSGYFMEWTDTFRLCEAYHLSVKDILPCVGLIAWDNWHMGMGYRARSRGDYLIILQKSPLRAKATWRDHGIPTRCDEYEIPHRWDEKVDRKIHAHIKPRGLISRIIDAVTKPEDLVVDPCAGSFTVMHAALELGRNFVGCDIAYTDLVVRELTEAAE